MVLPYAKTLELLYLIIGNFHAKLMKNRKQSDLLERNVSKTWPQQGTHKRFKTNKSDNIWFQTQSLLWYLKRWLNFIFHIPKLFCGPITHSEWHLINLNLVARKILYQIPNNTETKSYPASRETSLGALFSIHWKMSLNYEVSRRRPSSKSELPFYEYLIGQKFVGQNWRNSDMVMKHFDRQIDSIRYSSEVKQKSDKNDEISAFSNKTFSPIR